METILLGIFITGYLLITLEHSLKIDKLIPALAMMAFLWAVIAIFHIPVLATPKTSVILEFMPSLSVTFKAIKSKSIFSENSYRRLKL